MLDRLILYLRVVHACDYYACKLYADEDDEPRRIGTFTLRDEPHRRATPKRLAHYIKSFETRLKMMLPAEGKLADEHVEVSNNKQPPMSCYLSVARGQVLGKRDMDAEVDKFVSANTIVVHDGMTKCCLCFKRFTSQEYAVLHMKEKHADRLEEVCLCCCAAVGVLG